MKYKVLAQNFINAAQAAGASTEANSAVEEFKRIMIIPDGDKISVIGMGVAWRCRVTVGISMVNDEDSAPVCVSPKLVLGTAQVMYSAGAETITITHKGDDILMVGARKRATIRGLSKFDRDLPLDLYDNLDKEHLYFRMNSGLFKSLISKVAPSCDYSGVYNILECVFLTCVQDNIEMVATDGFTLSRATLQHGFAGYKNMQDTILLDGGILTNITKVLPNDGDIDCYISGTAILFSLDNMVIRMVETSGKPPEYKDIIPNDSHSLMTVRAKELATNIKGLFNFADERTYKTVKFTFDTDYENIVLDAITQDVGSMTSVANTIEMSDDVSCLTDIDLTYDYILRLVSSFVGVSDINFYGTDKLAPLLLKGQCDNYVLEQIIMPQNLKEME